MNRSMTRPQTPRSFASLSLAVAVTIAVSACGGGSGGVEPTSVALTATTAGASQHTVTLDAGEPMDTAQSVQSPNAPAISVEPEQVALTDTGPKVSESSPAADQPEGDPVGYSMLTAPDSVEASPNMQAQGTAIRSENVLTPNFTPSVYAGTGWHVDSVQGDDRNPGTRDRPWRTLARVSQAKLSPGDAILLKCGSGWREPLTLSASSPAPGPLLVSAYGDCTEGRRPSIRLLSVASAWTRDSTRPSDSNVFITKATGAVGALVVNGSPQLPARMRNDWIVGREFSLSSGATSPVTIRLDDAAKAINPAAMIGATLHLRTRPWLVESATVTAFDQATATATLATRTQFLGSSGSGYIASGRDWMVDHVGEWAQHTDTGVVTSWLPNGLTPSNSTIELATQPYGIQVTGIAGVTIERVRIEYPTKIGIDIRNSPGFVVRDVQVINPGETGIQVDDVWATAPSNRGTIDRSVILGAGSTGIRVMAEEVNISNNMIRDTGIVNRAAGSVAGIYIRSTAGVLESNTISNSAYSAIMYVNRGGGRVAGNVIDAACMRLSDCGAIYVWGTNPTNSRGLITRNAVRNVRPNLNGAVGGAIDLAVGIYLDEHADQFDVIGNMISDVGVGINLHKAQNNLVSDNRIWLASNAGIRGQSEPGSVDPLRGNVVRGNTIFMSRHFDAPGPTGLPLRRTSAAQEWIHPVAASLIFSGTNPNVISANSTILLGSPTLAQWVLRSGTSQQAIGFNAWQAFTRGETLATPLDAKMSIVSGQQLLANATMEAPAAEWKSYFYPPVSGSAAARIVTGADCMNSCLEFTAGTDLDVVYQAGVKNHGWTASSLYFLTYTVTGGSKGGQMKAEVRKDFSPFAPAGFLEDRYDLLPHTLIRQEAFFRPADATDLRVSFKGKPGSPMYIDEVQLVRIDGVKLFDPRLYSAHLINVTNVARRYTCADAGLAACDVVDASGQTISWPIEVPAGSSRMAFAVDGIWTRRR